MKAAKIIQENKDQIIDNWLKKLKQEFPEVKNYGNSAIEDDVPDLIDALIDTLKFEKDKRLKSIGKAHGKQRTGFADYSLIHVIREYRILKMTIFEEVDNKVEINNEERNKIINVIDKTIEQAVSTFFDEEKGKIIQDKEKAEESFEKLKNDDAQRDYFISAVSHDLNNPINNIKMAVQILQSDKRHPQLDRLLNIISQGADKAENLIKDLLDVNMIKSGAKLALEIGDCNLLPALSNTIDNYQIENGNKIILKTDLQELQIKADCEALIRAAENLIDNAIKYGDNEKPIIIECYKKEDFITIKVINYGNPIPPEKQSNLFSRFYRIGNSKKKGWGIGLSLVKGITEAHGGEVAVESTADKGTLFTMVIPVKYSENKVLE